MKDLITSCAAVIILMMFVLQFVSNQTTYTRIALCDAMLAKERIAQVKELSEIRDDVADILGCASNEVKVKVEDDGGIEVEAKIYGIIGPYRILGLSAEENHLDYKARF